MIDYDKLILDSRFYFSDPGNAKPPTAGLWHNRSKDRYEVWDYVPYRKKQRVFNEFKTIAHIKLAAKDTPEAINNFFNKVMQQMIEAFGPLEAEAWLRTGKSTKQLSTSPKVTAKFH